MSRQNRQGRRREINVLGHAHELTFSCYQGFPFLRAERTCQWLANALSNARQKHDFQLWAFVFMPEHVHLIIYPNQATHRMRTILSAIKLPVSQQAVRFLMAENSTWLERITRTRGNRRERLFWQSGGGYDRNITHGKTLLSMIEYVHENPVRRELATSGRDWKWSSAAWFEGGTSPIVLDPIPAEWLADV